MSLGTIYAPGTRSSSTDLRLPSPAAGRSGTTFAALVDRVLGAGQGAAPATLALTDGLLAAYPTIPLPAVHVARLDAALPGLLAGVRSAETAAPVSLCAVLSARVSSPVGAGLRRLSRSRDPRLAVAAHVTALLVEGMSLSETHLRDVTTVQGIEPLLDRWPYHRSTRRRALSLVRLLTGDAGPADRWPTAAGREGPDSAAGSAGR
jgi:hypothetical protein